MSALAIAVAINEEFLVETALRAPWRMVRGLLWSGWCWVVMLVVV